MSTKQQQRGAADVGAIHVQTLPLLPRILPWFKAYRSEDKTLVQFAEWYDKQMELWRRQVEVSLVGNFNTIRLMMQGQVGGLTNQQVQDMIDESIKGIKGGDTIITGVDREEVYAIVTAANATFIHVQTTPEILWTVVHNLGRYPPVSVVDADENVIGCNVTYIDKNSLTAAFAVAASGKAYLG
jgi:hypothetical protein